MAYKRKKKGRGDSVWMANKTRGVCGLSGNPIQGKDQFGGQAHKCLYLKVLGDQADPVHQIVGRPKTDGSGKVENVKPDGTLFRSVPTGRYRCKRNACKEEYNYMQRFCNAEFPGKPGKTCRAPTGPIFKWQEGRPTGEVDANGEPQMHWHDVNVWEQAVIVDEAISRGFHVPMLADGKFRETEAEVGERTEGHAHSVSAVAESPLADLARAALEEDEGGEPAPPAPKAESEELSEEDRDWLASL